MKKIILLLFTLFIVINKVNAVTFHLGEKVEPLFYVQRSDLNRTHNGLIFKLLRSDNEFVYCIEPFENRVSNIEYTEYNYNNSIFNLSDEQLDRLNMIGYFGYGYKDHTDIKWYGITQFLIWSNLNLKDIFLTDTSYGNKIEPYNSEINEIYSLIDEYKKLPSFANNTIYYTKNNTYELIDSNKVLDSFDIISSDLNIKKESNKLIINTEEDGIYNISFIKRSPIERSYKLYYANDTQNFIYPGKFNDIKFDLTIKVVTGKINLNKIGYTSSIDSSLGGAIYGLYQNNLQVGSITTDNNGKGYIDNLPIGRYVLKEIVPSKGYMLDVNKFDIDITESRRDIYIESYERLIYDRLIINKYYGDTEYTKEDGAVFNIYDSKYNLYETVETKNGQIDIVLPYGRYKVEQIKGIEGYKMTEPFDIKIDEATLNRYNLYDELIKGDLVLNKYNMDDNSCEKEDGAIFEIYKDNTLYKTVETKDGLIDIKLPYGKYIVKQISGVEGYKFVDAFEVFIDKEDSFIYNLYNELIYGNLILNKYYGEPDKFDKEDGAVFEVYKDNTLYNTYQTIDGVIDIKLPYGDYMVKQIKGKEGYKFTNNIEVNITEENIYEYNLYDELIYGNLILNKYYGESDKYEKEDGAVFKVSNDTISYEGITDSGILSMKLPYGEYKVEQLNGISGYSYVDDFNINIKESNSYDYNLYDEIIVNVPNTGIKRTINYIFLVYIFIGLSLIIYSLKKATHY